MDSITEPTRTADTIIQYKIRRRLLIKAFMLDASIQHLRDIKTCELGAWMIGRKPTLAPATWRQYRSALLCYAETSKILNYDELKEILNSKQGESAGGAIASKRQQRAKSLKPDEILLIQNYFNAKIRCRDSHEMTFAFFMACIATGLRPCEWKHARLEIINGQAKLVVRNAKYTNGRSHGEFRTIHISASETAALHFIKLTLKNIKKIEGYGANDELFTLNYAKRMKTMQKQFSNMNKFLFPRRRKRIHLYTPRHQVVANLKALGFTKVQLAAVLGQASIETATTHYGLGRNGKGGLTVHVQPDSDDVARVEALNVNRVIKSHPTANIESLIKPESTMEKIVRIAAEIDSDGKSSTTDAVKNKSLIHFEGLDEMLPDESISENTSSVNAEAIRIDGWKERMAAILIEEAMDEKPSIGPGLS